MAPRCLVPGLRSGARHAGYDEAVREVTLRVTWTIYLQLGSPLRRYLGWIMALAVTLLLSVVPLRTPWVDLGWLAERAAPLHHAGGCEQPHVHAGPLGPTELGPITAQRFQTGKRGEVRTPGLLASEPSTFAADAAAYQWAGAARPTRTAARFAYRLRAPPLAS